MKNLIIVIFAAFSFFGFKKQDGKLKGRYKMEYDYSFGSQNGIINFDGDTYTRKQIDGKKVKGFVSYQKYFITLNDKDCNLQVKFPTREKGKDTIFFRTIDLNDKSVNNDPLTVYGGKLIKVRN